MPTGLCNFVGLCKRWLVFIPNWIRNDLNTCTISYLQPPFTPLSTPFACRSSCLSIFPLPLPIHLSDRQTVCLSFFLSALLSVRPSDSLSMCLSVCLSVCLFVRLSVCLSVCPSSYLSVCLSVCPSICLSVCLSVYPLSVCLSVCPSVSLSICFSVCFLTSCLPGCPSLVCPRSFGLSTCLYVFWSFYFLSLRLSVRLFCLSISDCRFVGLFVSPSTISGSLPVFPSSTCQLVCLPVCQSVCLSGLFAHLCV